MLFYPNPCNIICLLSLKVQTDVEILLLAALTHINPDDAMQDCRKGEEGLEHDIILLPPRGVLFTSVTPSFLVLLFHQPRYRTLPYLTMLPHLIGSGGMGIATDMGIHTGFQQGFCLFLNMLSIHSG